MLAVGAIFLMMDSVTVVMSSVHHHDAGVVLCGHAATCRLKWRAPRGNRGRRLRPRPVSRDDYWLCKRDPAWARIDMRPMRLAALRAHPTFAHAQIPSDTCYSTVPGRADSCYVRGAGGISGAGAAKAIARAEVKCECNGSRVRIPPFTPASYSSFTALGSTKPPAHEALPAPGQSHVGASVQGVSRGQATWLEGRGERSAMTIQPGYEYRGCLDLPCGGRPCALCRLGELRA